VRAAVTAFIALGANLGDPQAAVAGAMERISAIEGVRLIRRSALYRTTPIDSSGPDYVNAVVEVETVLTAPDLLSALQRIEYETGRTRPYRNAPRSLDLDLLLYGEACIDSPTLIVPHPRMLQRAFVLAPLAEIAPQRVSAAQLDAVRGQSIEQV
jgi:2-amino-4-hydroxy-6-hydroxymethyldihydropteridine diphosphokinase